MSRAASKMLLLAVAMLLMGACRGGEASAPVLVAPPTRTPAPYTSTPQPTAVPVLEAQVIDLRGPVLAFLGSAQGISPLERSLMFDQYVTRAVPECAAITLFPGTQLVQVLDRAGLDLVSADLEAWRQSAEALPVESLSAAIQAEMARIGARLPLAAGQSAPRVCLLPVPPWHDRRAAAEAEPVQMGAQALGADLILVWCAAGAPCAEAIAPQLAYQAAYAYQLAASGLTMATATLLDLLLLHGRAALVARALHPQATFDWQATLEPTVEAELWGRMRAVLHVTYDHPDFRRIDRFLYGRNTREYPRLGGLIIGEQIVRAFRAAHPEVSDAELLRMPAAEVLAASGYDPG